MRNLPAPFPYRKRLLAIFKNLFRQHEECVFNQVWTWNACQQKSLLHKPPVGRGEGASFPNIVSLGEVWRWWCPCFDCGCGRSRAIHHSPLQISHTVKWTPAFSGSRSPILWYSWEMLRISKHSHHTPDTHQNYTKPKLIQIGEMWEKTSMINYKWTQVLFR